MGITIDPDNKGLTMKVAGSKTLARMVHLDWPTNTSFWVLSLKGRSYGFLTGRGYRLEAGETNPDVDAKTGLIRQRLLSLGDEIRHPETVKVLAPKQALKSAKERDAVLAVILAMLEARSTTRAGVGGVVVAPALRKRFGIAAELVEAQPTQRLMMPKRSVFPKLARLPLRRR
ncbi:hypothetical protein HK107_10815 [Parvularcula sp. ZS-1/3]|uniref:Uncharacterized protein n=1 Tax=Parvularcula mediterranea TaxID=2732508 RepID=A0A7Y3W5N4_9PROT|nr:hypothetical protein [Parvularcula mediterranea]NNU16809.1 hypothetical protein [Parvularcula mediterranea]